ncbi:hypothetical protein [Methylobacterium haplocladii]|nr:hypothetical protein [Methylobacterium haplocladii]GJD85590.1 hypothetical protein HPGCJGGD_3479 [Methylobacterium haplocladii]
MRDEASQARSKQRSRGLGALIGRGRRQRTPPLPADFDSDLYLDLNADVAMAIETGTLASAAEHYLAFGRNEGRHYRPPAATTELGGGLAAPWTFRYPYRAYGALPAMEFAEPAAGPNDEAIARRIIAAWNHAAARTEREGRPDTEGMWAARTRGFSRFHRALRDADAPGLATMLAGLFQSHLAHGLAMGRATATFARHAPEPFAASWCDRLLRLAEALALADVRSPEQSDYTAPWAIPDLHTRIEAELGFPLRFPEIGAPYGVRFGGSLLPEHAFSHAYAAWRIGQIDAGPRLAEIGGGFGGLAWFMNRPDRRYTILDLPFTNALQGWFLLKTGLEVSLYGESDAAIRVLPWWEIESADTYDLVINQDSLPEMPQETASGYIARIRAIAPLFYSINQEAAAANTEALRQGIVPELVARDGGYRRLSRNMFWLRDGYVEELYTRR